MAIREDRFRAIISGRRKDATARVTRSLLGAASLGYGLAVRVRNALYDHHLLGTHRVNAAVLCVGNITTGGTGKTPLVVWLCRFLSSRGIPHAILSRGYRADRHASVDEPAMLAECCSGAQVVVNPDRIAGATQAIQHLGVQVLVMDDGFQHRRLARDLDIVTVDATCPFGYGRLLPAGLLREPPSSLRRAHAIVLTHCDQVTETELGALEARLRNLCPHALLARTAHAPKALMMADGTESGLEVLRNRRVFAFCGIANPGAFFNSIRGLGAELAGSRTFNDHHRYTDACIDSTIAEAGRARAELILTTQKDWTKVRDRSIPARTAPLAYLAIEIRFFGAEDRLIALIEQTLQGTMPKNLGQGRAQTGIA